MAENPQPKTCPIPRDAVIDRYFLEHRAKLLDVAAFLDRIDRASESTPGSGADADEDFRVEAMRRAITLLSDGDPQRTRRILELFSDHTDQPIDKAPMKGATGAAESK